jgi:hypothetical protein
MPPNSLKKCLTDVQTQANIRLWKGSRINAHTPQGVRLVVQVHPLPPSLREIWSSGRPADCKSAASGHGWFEPSISHQIMEQGISRAETQHRDCVAGRRDFQQFMGWNSRVAEHGLPCRGWLNSIASHHMQVRCEVRETGRSHRTHGGQHEINNWGPVCDTSLRRHSLAVRIPVFHTGGTGAAPVGATNIDTCNMCK